MKNNGTLKEFNATEFMNKVYERETSLHTVREHDGKEYTIIVGGHNAFMELDGTETWDIDIIVEDADGKQERIGKYSEMSNLTKDECIAKMEAMVKEIIAEETEGETLALNEYMNHLKNVAIRYDGKQDAVEAMAKEMKQNGIDADMIYSIKEKMLKDAKPDISNGEWKAFRAWQNTVRKNHYATALEMHDFLWENEVAGFILALRTAGLKKFYYTNQSTAVMENLHGFTAAGCKIGKMITIEEEVFRGKTTEILGIEIILAIEEIREG